VGLADTIFETGFRSEQEILSKVKLPGEGTAKVKLESPNAEGYVGLPGEPGAPGTSSLGGIFTVTIPGAGGTGGEMFTDTHSLTFPFTTFSRGENKVGLKAGEAAWSDFRAQLEDFVNRSHGFTLITDTRSLARTAEVGGPIQITSAKSAGKIKADKKTYSKYKGSLRIRYTGVVASGPNQGQEVEGMIKVKMKKGEPLVP
jgi:hypothetical protein